MERTLRPQDAFLRAGSSEKGARAKERGLQEPRPPHERPAVAAGAPPAQHPHLPQPRGCSRAVRAGGSLRGAPEGTHPQAGQSARQLSCLQSKCRGRRQE